MAEERGKGAEKPGRIAAARDDVDVVVELIGGYGMGFTLRAALGAEGR